MAELVSWCFETNQPLMIISGLKTNLSPSLRYSAHQSFNTSYSIYFYRTVKLLDIKSNISTEPQCFYTTYKIFLHTKFTSAQLVLFRTYQSLSGTQQFSLDSHFGTVNTKISPQSISFSPPLNQHTLSR